MRLKDYAYYENNNVNLYYGNCIEILKKIKKDSIDMIFADPPYGLSNNGITCKNGKMVSVNKGEWDKSKGIEEDFKFHNQWIKACQRVLKPNGTIWISGTYHSIYACGYALQKNKFKVLNEISWFKPNAAPNLSCKYFTASHETIIWAIKESTQKHTYNYKTMKHGDWHKKDIIKNEDKQMRSVWSIATPSKKEKLFGKHPTQKPIKLLERIILSSTNENDIILDPFTGSSTTGVVALQNNRQFIGIDMEKEYLNLSIKRIHNI
ncbi:DNA methylase N-4/N-6 domain protein [Arcobacter nitrofigilis DSM 7299]|uniref:Methyltransferase n=1 Tax=Arcobacter nitrofigilis (strain ATCC 33309 / DSM 7299 / CCUG 15893 / LMG 7604 / NCTC 12251 / CI) TaxID=572480 RepID=D5V7L5_ARCNC|nr:site-specific DNA-methyltransferase [Arcobacter nitrofigilis]ADG94635.1 DNA methylase N-4/N-6 domain protein [Arcobacter nitrofigilis DSM 7299]